MEIQFRGCGIQKNHLFNEMKQNIRDCSIPSLAPTSRFKKKRVKFKSTTSEKLNSKQSQLKNKNSLKNRSENLRTLYGRLPEEFKFYLQFELKRVEFENYKSKFKDIKNNKIRSTFGDSSQVDQQLENLMDKLYSIIRELNFIGNQYCSVNNLVTNFENENFSDSDDSISHLSGSSPLLALSNSSKNINKDRLRKNMGTCLNIRLRRMIHFLRTQEHQYLKISKNISNTKFNSDFDFMTEEPVETWDDIEGREDLMMIDITNQDSSEEMKNVLEKINKLTKMLTSVNEVEINYCS
jgi:hypothetical protein